jgi:monoamine oxidase
MSSETQPDNAVTRRRLLGGAAVAGASAALPAGAQAAAKKKTKAIKKVDVCVVGAGLSGLAAARAVAAKGKSVQVIEARTRVGGRTLNHPIGGGEIIEVGGQWVGPSQTRLLALAKELGVATFKTYNSGNYIYHRNGVNTPYSATGPLGPIPPDPTGITDAVAAISKLDQMAATVPLDAPWTAPQARVYDSQTFETWKLANTTTSSGRFLLDLAIESVWACEPADVSLLHVLFYIHGAGTLNDLISTAGGAQDSRFVGGSQLLSIRQASKLGAGRITLGSPVRRLVQTGGRVLVESDKLTVSAKRVIVTGPPAVGAYIDYEPILPPDRAQLLQRFPQGSAIKVQAIYDKPFWREKGLAGQVTSDASPVRLTFDNSPPDGSPGVMLGFLEGHAARSYVSLPVAQRRAAVLANFATYFGPEALKPNDYVEMAWEKEEWTRGCYVGYTPPGVLTEYGTAIRKPVGRIHWAGAETATVWNGYMDGAVRSGERAAAEVLAEI